MSVSKSKMASNKKHDSTHFKYQSVKLKITEYELLKKAVELSKEPMNTFLRTAIMQRVNEYVPEELSPRAAEVPPAPEVAEIVHEVSEEIPTPPKAPTTSEDISVLDLSVRTFNIVCRAGVRTVAELEAWVHSDKCCLDPERSPGYKEILEALKTYKEKG